MIRAAHMIFFKKYSFALFLKCQIGARDSLTRPPRQSDSMRHRATAQRELWCICFAVG
jgi:hypothetical protein